MRVPGLTATAFHDPAAFPWNPAFEAATDEVIAEFTRVPGGPRMAGQMGRCHVAPRLLPWDLVRRRHGRP